MKTIKLTLLVLLSLPVSAAADEQAGSDSAEELVVEQFCRAHPLRCIEVERECKSRPTECRSRRREFLRNHPEIRAEMKDAVKSEGNNKVTVARTKSRVKVRTKHTR